MRIDHHSHHHHIRHEKIEPIKSTSLNNAPFPESSEVIHNMMQAFFSVSRMYKDDSGDPCLKSDLSIMTMAQSITSLGMSIVRAQQDGKSCSGDSVILERLNRPLTGFQYSPPPSLYTISQNIASQPYSSGSMIAQMRALCDGDLKELAGQINEWRNEALNIHSIQYQYRPFAFEKNFTPKQEYDLETAFQRIVTDLNRNGIQPIISNGKASAAQATYILEKLKDLNSFFVDNKITSADGSSGITNLFQSLLGKSLVPGVEGYSFSDFMQKGTTPENIANFTNVLNAKLYDKAGDSDIDYFSAFLTPLADGIEKREDPD